MILIVTDHNISSHQKIRFSLSRKHILGKTTGVGGRGGFLVGFLVEFGFANTYLAYIKFERRYLQIMQLSRKTLQMTLSIIKLKVIPSEIILSKRSNGCSLCKVDCQNSHLVAGSPKKRRQEKKKNFNKNNVYTLKMKAEVQKFCRCSHVTCN